MITVLARHAVPKYFLSDRGRQFDCEVLKELCILLGVKKQFTTPYHPQCNGQVERFNKTLCRMLKAYVNQAQDDWDAWLPYVTFAYVTAQHKTTGYTPFFLIYGRDPVIPTVILAKDSTLPHNVNEYVKLLIQRLKAATADVLESVKKAQEKQKRYHDRNIKDVLLDIGDKVLLTIPKRQMKDRKLSKKLSVQREGVYAITRKINDLCFEITHSNNERDVQRLHVNRLSRYREYEDALVNPSSSSNPALHNEEGGDSSNNGIKTYG